MRTRQLLRWAPVVVIAVLATGCSGGGAESPSAASKAPEVATLDSPTPVGKADSSQPATADPDAGRPRERIDMTEADRQRLYAPYLQCMKDHGAELDLSPKKAGSNQSRVKNPQNADAAGRACQGKLPLPPWEVDANNPDALDFGRKVVQCLKNKGVRYVELSNGTDSGIVGPSFGGPNNDQESIKKGLDLTPACEREVAGK